MSYTQIVKNLVTMVADTVAYNPRRMKQFVNIFRLQAYIANNTGLFNPPVGTPPMTPEQLGKFVANWSALAAVTGGYGY